MIEQLFASIVAAVISFFGTNVPPQEANPVSTYTQHVGGGLCTQVFDQNYENNAEYSQLWGADILLQTCENGSETLELRTDTETVSNTNKTAQEYTIRHTNPQGAASEFTVNLDLNPYGPGCEITEMQADESGMWSNALVSCMAGDGGFSRKSLHVINLAQQTAENIEICTGRPLAILDSAGNVATYSSTQDCTYPFGTTESGGSE